MISIFFLAIGAREMPADVGTAIRFDDVSAGKIGRLEDQGRSPLMD
jgi:hypothetical protein